MKTLKVPTPYAEIAVVESEGDGPAVLMIHGNSSSKEVFQRQLDSPLAQRLRLIAIDLPGHGGSSNARAPASAYTIGGYAAAATEVLAAMGVAEAVVFGWSLGGHVALDMIARFPGLRGVLITGTPPVPAGVEGLAAGFRQSAEMALTGARDWSEADVVAYVRATCGAEAPPFMYEAARRTHGVARETFLADALSGGVADQRQIVETSSVPLAIVNGAEDPFLNQDYFETIAYANLWGGKVVRLEGLGHAPFWEDADRFNPLLERFVRSTTGAA